MPQSQGLRCRHAFEALTIHANGEVVCSIIDGRGDFVLGNVNHDRLQDILSGPRIRELRRLVLRSKDQFCPAIGKHCPLKNIATGPDEEIGTPLRFLMIEPTTACDLRCLSCPVRDFSRDVTWKDAYRDGGVSFLAWDGLRRAKQHAADGLRRALPQLSKRTPEHGPLRSALFRGRVSKSRTGTLPIQVLKRVITDAGRGIERIDLFNYGEPFLYRHLVDALQHIRMETPSTEITISTDGMQVRQEVEEVIVRERLLDWLIFSVDGVDEESYQRYRIGGRFEVAFSNMLRFHRRALGSGIRVIWQYVVFRWNDSDDQFKQAIDSAEQAGIPIWFDFAHSWGHSRRRPQELNYLKPYLRPFTALPGEMRQGGW